MNSLTFQLPFPARESEYGEEAGARNLAWALRHGLVIESDHSRYFAASIPLLMSRWLPDASLDGLVLGIDALSFAFLLDDQFDSPLGNDPGRVASECAILTSVLDGRGGENANPLSRAFSDIWTRETVNRSAPWIARAAIHWRWFFEACVEEATNRATGATQTVEGYLRLRRKSGVVYMMIDLIEASYSFETTSDDRAIGHTQNLLRLACDIVGTLNDLYSLDKEVTRGDPHNLVLVLERQNATTRAAAIDHSVALVLCWSEQFLEQAKTLPDNPPALRRLINSVAIAIGGFHRWQARSTRYSKIIPPHQDAYRSLLMER